MAALLRGAVLRAPPQPARGSAPTVAAELWETFHFPAAAAAASWASSSAFTTSSCCCVSVPSFSIGSCMGCIFIAPTPRRSGASPPPLAPPPLPPARPPRSLDSRGSAGAWPGSRRSSGGVPCPPGPTGRPRCLLASSYRMPQLPRTSVTWAPSFSLAPPGPCPASPCETPLVPSSTHSPTQGISLPPFLGTFQRAVDSLLIRSGHAEGLKKPRNRRAPTYHIPQQNKPSLPTITPATPFSRSLTTQGRTPPPPTPAWGHWR